jgi:hypothetical protein
MPKPAHVVRRLALPSLVLSVLLGAGCSSGTTRESARSQATTQTCQRFDMCMFIGDGAGKTYPTIQACEIDWQANWDKAWPAADCDGKIDQQAFETCLAAIRGTDCKSFGDFLVTLGKCGKANVCRATSDAGGG